MVRPWTFSSNAHALEAQQVVWVGLRVVERNELGRRVHVVHRRVVELPRYTRRASVRSVLPLCRSEIARVK